MKTSDGWWLAAGSWQLPVTTCQPVFASGSMTVDERIMKHDNLASFIPITTIIATITRTIVDAAIIEMYPRAFIKTFQPGTVLMQAMKSPQLPKKWAVHDFHDKKLCGLVLEAFRKAGLEPADFEEAIHSAREQVYKASRNNFLQAIGIPYGQWKAMEIACELLDVKGFSFGVPQPFSIEGPADPAYTTMFLKKVHNFEFEDQSFHMEGLSLDSWCLYKVEASTAAAGLKKPVAATAPAGGSNKSTAAAVAAPAGGSKKPAAAGGSKKSTAAAAAPAGGSKKPDAATTSATGSKKPITTTAPAGGSNKSAAAAATTTTTTSAAGAKKPAKAKAGLAGSRWALGGSSRSPPPKAPSPPPEIPLRDLGKSSWAPGGPSRDRKGWGKGKGKGKAE